MTRRRPSTYRWAWVGACAACLSALGSTAQAAETPYPGDLGQALAAVAVFAVLLVILGKYAWRPIVQQLKRREEAIAETIARAEKTQKTAEELLAGYEQKMADAETQVQEMIAQAQAEGAADRREIVGAARQEAQRVAEAATEEIGRAKAAARVELQHTTARLATDIAGQILGRQLTSDQQQTLIDQSLSEIRQQADEAS